MVLQGCWVNRLSLVPMDPQALQRSEREIAKIVAAALRDAGPLPIPNRQVRTAVA